MINKYDNYRNRFINRSVDGVQDPLYLTFGLRFEFFPRISPDESLEPGLLSGGARDFLSSRGDDLRVQKLDYFVNLLRKFSIEEPWWFTQLSGVNDLLTLNNEGPRLPEGTSFTVSSRESVDMKFLSLMEAYRSTVQDKKYMRDILVKNLRFFDMSIYLIDPRILLKRNGNKLEYDDDSQGVIVLKLRDCEFVFDDYSGLASSITNEGTEDDIKHTFEIIPRRILEVYNLPTKELFGYGGTGYFSDDNRQDFNFLTNFVRPKTGLYAEQGNERRPKEEDYQDFKDSNKIKISNVEEESAEEAKLKREIRLPDNINAESSEREQLDLGELNVSSSRREQLDLGNLEVNPDRRIPEAPKNINPESNKRDELELGLLEVISNRPPRIIE